MIETCAVAFRRFHAIHLFHSLSLIQCSAVYPYTYAYTPRHSSGVSVAAVVVAGASLAAGNVLTVHAALAVVVWCEHHLRCFLKINKASSF